jgi:pyruvate formate lyase activating enzyme
MGETCRVCFRKCMIEEGARGFCGARTCRDGKVIADNYGKITSIALDPIEKKPLNNFHPGAYVLSVGSYGCNLRCPFCQNHDISWGEGVLSIRESAETIMPDELVEIAKRCVPQGNIGLAFTYNEPLVGYEYVRDCAKLSKESGLKNVLVTNGTATREVLGEILPYIDAMNIDLKTFSKSGYRDILGGDLEMVKAFIEMASGRCHVELTALIVPGLNDDEKEFEEMCEYISGLGRDIPLHVTRFFPRFKMTDCAATDVGKLFRLCDLAKKHLEYVYPGNV